MPGLFKFGRKKEEPFRQEWVGWPTPYTGPVPSIEPNRILEAWPGAASLSNPDRYPSTLVIGLGPTGERVIRGWLERVWRSASGPQEKITALLITRGPVEPLPLENRQFCNLTLDSTDPRGESDPWNISNREQVYRRFCKAGIWSDFLSVLDRFMRNLESGTRCLVVGSPAESFIGCLGPTLAALRLVNGASQKLASVIGLISVVSPQPNLDDGEVYAALREIGRFTFSGFHSMGALGGQEVPNCALLDHLFLLDGKNHPHDRLKPSSKISAQELQSVLIEALFALLHPASSHLLETLPIGDVSSDRNHLHQPVIHTLGIASLHAPLLDAQEYMATRLAAAALFGEQRRFEDGLLHPDALNRPLNSEVGKDLVFAWLERSPWQHPFFRWLLLRDPEEKWVHFPPISTDHGKAFSLLLAYGLTDYLNTTRDPEPLHRVREALSWLNGRLGQIELEIEKNDQTVPVPGRQGLKQFLTAVRPTVQHLLEQVNCWQESLLSIPASWINSKNLQNQPLKFENRTSKKLKMDQPAHNIFDLMKNRLENLEKTLKESSSSPVSQPLLGSGENAFRIVDDFYRKALRPVLVDGSMDTAFQHVRERLFWWLRLEDEPRLYLVLYPAEIKRSDPKAVPPVAALFTWEQVEPLIETLIEIARSQVSSLQASFVNSWVMDNLGPPALFLSQAENPLLEIDFDRAYAEIPNRARKGALLVPALEHGDACKIFAFQNIDPTQVEIFPDYEPGLITALSIHYSFPLDSVTHFQKNCYPSYKHRTNLHLFSQEKNAVEYERMIFAISGVWEFIPPDLSIYLADQQLVTFFCQGLFTGLIRPVANQEDMLLRWSVASVAPDFKELPLAQGGEMKDLEEAFRQFTIELPRQPGLPGNFSNPFHPERREAFLQSFEHCWKQIRLDQDRWRMMRADAAERILKVWEGKGKLDPFAKAFALILKVELDQPVWNSR